MEKNWKTREFFLSILNKMDVSYTTDQQGTINFSWQGGHFTAEADDNCAFIVIWYLGWEVFSLDDTETFERVQKVINTIHLQTNMMVAYTVDLNTHNYYLHTKKHLLFIPSIEEADEYLKAMLGECFNITRFFETELEKIKIEEGRNNFN